MNQPTSTIPHAPDTQWAPPGWGTPTEPAAWGAPIPPAPAKKSRKGYIVAAVLAFIVGSAIIGAATKDPDETFGGTTSVSTASSGGGAAAVAAWARRNQSDLSAIVADSEAAEAAAGRGSFTGLSSACAELESDVTTAQTHLPIPDATVNSHYSDALRYYVLAAQTCQTGADNYDTSDLQQSAHYLELASSSLHQATAALP